MSGKPWHAPPGEGDAPRTPKPTAPTGWQPPAADPMLLDDLDSFLLRAAFDETDLQWAAALVDRIAQARAASAPADSSGPMQSDNCGWQPIETAPKDGSDVLLFQPYDPEDFTAGGHVWTDSWDEDAPGGPDWDVNSMSEPTHWRECLAPPPAPQTETDASA